MDPATAWIILATIAGGDLSIDVADKRQIYATEALCRRDVPAARRAQQTVRAKVTAMSYALPGSGLAMTEPRCVEIPIKR